MRTISIVLFCIAAVPAIARGAGHFKVESIGVVGLQGLSQEAVLHQLPLQIGDWFDESKSEDVIKALYASQWFKDVKLTRRGSRLEISVVERPIISQVRFKGSHGIPQEGLDKMLQEIGLAGGGFFNPSALELLKTSLTQMYIAAGKHAAKIVTSVIPEADNIVQVKVEVEPGPTLRFESVRLFGVQAFTEKRVLAELPMSTHRFWGFVEGKFNHCTRETREQILDALRRFYKNQGYYDIRVNTHQLSVTGNRCNADWVIELTEGPRYRIGQYRILGEAYGLTQAKLQALIGFKSGDYYSERAVKRAKNEIQEYFGEKGYLFAKVVIKPHVDAKTCRIHLAIQVDRGEKNYVRRIDFLGSHYIKESILRRLVVQEEASVASSKDHEISEDNLQHSGLLEQADIEVLPVAGTQNQVDLAVNIKEKPISFTMNPIGLNWGGEGAVWHTDLNFENVLGTGQDVLLKVIKDRKRMAAECGYKSNYTDFLGLQDVRWNIRGHLSDHNLQPDLETLKKLFTQSPYVHSMKAHGTAISDAWKALFSKSEKEKSKSKEGEKGLPAPDEKKSEKTIDLDEGKVKRTRYTFDEWGWEFGLELPKRKGSSTWQVTGEVKSLDFYYLDKKEYSDEVKSFLSSHGNKVDQVILGLARYNRQLKGHPYFPTGGSESRTSFSFAFSGITQSGKKGAGFALGERAEAFSKNPLNYFKLDYSGSVFRDLSPSSWLGSHVFGFRWNVGIGQKVSGKELGPLPFFDNYHSERFYGYSNDSLGPQDRVKRMLGGSLRVKGRGMYFLPKPFQGDFLHFANVAWPYRFITFGQVGNIYELDIKNISSLYKKSRQNFPLALSAGVACEVLCKIPMMGIMPIYASFSWPILEGGHAGHKAKHARYFDLGVGFVMH